ncbi:MAG TPA: hypothetical protein VL983_09480 [Terriglobales bacterium]|nr:hypothetical protein [Terriglobales bacterium]
MPVKPFLLRSFVMRLLVTMFLGAAALSSQEKTNQQTAVHPPPIASAAQEFPVNMRQNVIAGKTPVGAKVEARLTMATLMSGKVVPEGAVFSGVVVESAARSASNPSRLGIRMDSVQWKKDSVAVKAYLTSWYYPFLLTANNDSSNEQLGGIHGDVGIARGSGSRGGPGAPPYPNTPQQGVDVPSQPTSNVSDHRVEMKDVESQRASDGSLSIRSSRVNIKLDKSTTYVLATGELAASK